MFTPIWRHVGDTDPITLPIDMNDLKGLDLAQVEIKILVMKPGGKEVTWAIENANIGPESVTYKPQKEDLDTEGIWSLAVNAEWTKRGRKGDIIETGQVIFPGFDSFRLEVKPSS